MANRQSSITTTRRTSKLTQGRVRRDASSLIGNIVVVRTLFGSFTGCLLSIGARTIRLRIFSGFDRVFVTIRIPIGIILDIFRFRCP